MSHLKKNTYTFYVKDVAFTSSYEAVFSQDGAWTTCYS